MGWLTGDFQSISKMQRPQKTPRDAYDTPKDTQRCLETFDSSKDTQQCSERLFQRHLGMPGEFGILQRYLEMPGATQGAKNTLRDVKLPRATWVSPGFSRSKPLFPDVVTWVIGEGCRRTLLHGLSTGKVI